MAQYWANLSSVEGPVLKIGILKHGPYHGSDLGLNRSWTNRIWDHLITYVRPSTLSQFLFRFAQYWAVLHLLHACVQWSVKLNKDKILQNQEQHQKSMYIKKVNRAPSEGPTKSKPLLQLEGLKYCKLFPVSSKEPR